MREYSQTSLDILVVYVPIGAEGHKAEEHETPRDVRLGGVGMHSIQWEY